MDDVEGLGHVFASCARPVRAVRLSVACWWRLARLYARQLASGVRREAVGDRWRAYAYVLGVRGYTVCVFWSWLAWLASVLLPLASLTTRSALPRPYGLNIARLTHREYRPCSPASTQPPPSASAARAVALRCPRARAWAISLKSDKMDSPVPPVADSFAVGNRPMTSI